MNFLQVIKRSVSLIIKYSYSELHKQYSKSMRRWVIIFGGISGAICSWKMNTSLWVLGVPSIWSRLFWCYRWRLHRKVGGWRRFRPTESECSKSFSSLMFCEGESGRKRSGFGGLLRSLFPMLLVRRILISVVFLWRRIEWAKASKLLSAQYKSSVLFEGISLS